MRRGTGLLLVTLATVVGGADAQERLTCEDRWDRGDRARHCEIREERFAPTGRLAVDGGTNGGVRVQAWDREEVLVQAKVETWAEDEATARRMAQEIRIRTGATIAADGPEMRNRRSWGVSYLIFTPRATALDLKTHNGGIAIAGIDGEITFEALNGGVTLTDLAGNVRGETTNGGLRVRLAGDRWQGAGLDVETTNGGVRLEIPAAYSTRLTTGTVNGGIDIDFPITVQGRIGRRITTTLGSGGPPIRASTTNGGVIVTRR